MRRLPSLKKWIALALCGAAALSLTTLIAGCGKQARGASGFSGRVRVSGSTTLLALIQEASIEFMEANPRARVDVQGGGSSVGITQLKSGVVDIADSSRELKGEENGWGMVDHKVAFDIIAIIVNPKLNVRNLTSAQVKAIFTGKVRNWKAVGGPDKEIVVVVRDQASGTREVFDQKALGSTKENPVASEPSAIESPSNGYVQEIIATTSNAIGYLSYGFVNKTVKAVSVNGVLPEVSTATDGRYPMARWLHMFTKGPASGAVQGFIDFVLSPEFQRKVVSLEYIEVTRVRKQ
jgi:phosphate transport system substrate-binding protein